MTGGRERLWLFVSPVSCQRKVWYNMQVILAVYTT